MKRLSVRVVKIPVLCLTDKRSMPELEKALIRRGICPKKMGGAIFAEPTVLNLRHALPEMCEHSERVCIGHFYPELYMEHCGKMP